MRRIIQRINQLSFSRRLAVTFFICSFLTFLVIDVIMNILFATVVTSTTQGSNFNTESFSVFANNEILSSTQSAFQSNIDIYEQMMTQIYTTYHHFENSSLYRSRLVKGKNPPLSSTFTRKRYDRSSVYLFNQNSSFYDDPFIDRILAALVTEHYPVYLKRINVIYQSKQNERDIFIRTIPSTNDFYVPNLESISKRFDNLQQGMINTSDWYTDELSLSDNQTQLFALRLVQDENSENGPVKILIQIQIERKIFSSILESIISFKSTMLALIKQNHEQTYSIIGQTSNLLAEVKIEQFLQEGNQNVLIGNSQFLVTTKSLEDDNNDVQSDIHDNPSSTQEDHKNIDFKLIIFLNKTEAGAPNVMYDQFVKNQYSILVFILYGWTFIVLLFVIAIGVVVGDIIFSYFVLIRKKCRQYLQNPEQLHLLQDEMKQELKNQGRNRMVLQNIVLIMQRIENKKKQNRKSFKIQYDQYPFNPLNLRFQTKMKLDSYNKLQEISKIVQQRQEYLK